VIFYLFSLGDRLHLFPSNFPREKKSGKLVRFNIFPLSPSGSSLFLLNSNCFVPRTVLYFGSCFNWIGFDFAGMKRARDDIYSASASQFKRPFSSSRADSYVSSFFLFPIPCPIFCVFVNFVFIPLELVVCPISCCEMNVGLLLSLCFHLCG